MRGQTVTCDEDGRYTATRKPQYFGNLDAIDETGTKAAEHMAVADALRIVEKALAAPYQRHGDIRSQRLYDAMGVLARALRATPR
jgi:hypothetical protein